MCFEETVLTPLSHTPPCSPPPVARLGSPEKGCLQTTLYPRQQSGAHSAGSESGEERCSQSLKWPASQLTSHPTFIQKGHERSSVWFLQNEFIKIKFCILSIYMHVLSFYRSENLNNVVKWLNCCLVCYCKRPSHTQLGVITGWKLTVYTDECFLHVKAALKWQEEVVIATWASWRSNTENHTANRTFTVTDTWLETPLRLLITNFIMFFTDIFSCATTASNSWAPVLCWWCLKFKCVSCQSDTSF